jgi:Family of unknown function (DUF6328)
MDLQKKLKLALDENRLFILGTQVLFGFQFNGVFQELFVELPYASRLLQSSGLTLLMSSIAFLIAPSMHHRIVEGGQDNARVLSLATDFAVLALLPLSLTLAFDMFVAVAWAAGQASGMAVGAAFFVLAVFFWYALGFLMRRKKPAMAQDKTIRTPLDVQVDQLLTEARLIIPGAQALLGFQLTVTLARAFAELPPGVKMVHIAALCCIGLAVILLMAPASIHRIAFGGEDDPEFMKIASVFVVAAPLPLAMGIALDTYVAAGRALQSERIAAGMAVAAIIVLLGTWYVYPLAQRMRKRKVRR